MRHIRHLVLLISAALFGLICLQGYWLYNSYKLREQRFRQALHSAVQDAVERMHKYNAAGFLKSHVIPSGNGVTVTYRKEQKLQDGKMITKVEKKVIHRDSASLMERRADMIHQLLNEMMGAPSSGVVDSEETLDSILSISLDEHGISSSFEGNIFNAQKQSFLFDNELSSDAHLQQEAVKVELTDGSVFGAPEYLFLYLHGRKLQVLQDMWLMISLSLLFSSVVVIAYYVTLKNLVRQKRISEIKTDFINNMTHELKTPISTISLACQALEDPAMRSSEGSGERYIGIIKDENKRLSTLVEKVLQSAVLEKGELKLNVEPVNVEEVLDRSLSHFVLHIEARKGSIKKEYRCPGAVVLADAVHLENVFFNLIDNAVKYSAGPPEITVAALVMEGSVNISVSDKGIGIPSSQHQLIFDKLYRVPAGDVHNVKGFGLGLSYARQIIKMHGGSIDVDSQPGIGTKFIVTLPLYVGHE